MFLLNPFLYELFYLLVLIVNIIIIGSNDSMNKNIRSRDEITAVGWLMIDVVNLKQSMV